MLFITEDILTCHSSKSTCVTNNFINGCLLFPLDRWWRQHDSSDLELAHLKAEHSLIMIWITPVLFLLWHVKEVIGDEWNGGLGFTLMQMTWIISTQVFIWQEQDGQGHSGSHRGSESESVLLPSRFTHTNNLLWNMWCIQRHRKKNT